MAEYARKLIAGNPSLGQRITVRFLSLDFNLIDTVVNVPFLILVWGTFLSKLQVVKGKVEEVELPEKADILISEPMGKLIVPYAIWSFQLEFPWY